MFPNRKIKFSKAYHSEDGNVIENAHPPKPISMETFTSELPATVLSPYGVSVLIRAVALRDLCPLPFLI